MATKIEDIYDAIVTVVSTELAGYTRISDPYNLVLNTFLHLRQGFGLAIGAGVDTQRYVGCLVTWERTFTIALIQQMIATQNDLTTRVAIEKDILVDHDKIRKAIYLNSTLGGTAIKSTIIGDGGVNFIDGDRLKFLAIELDLVVEYQESPT